MSRVYGRSILSDVIRSLNATRVTLLGRAGQSANLEEYVSVGYTTDGQPPADALTEEERAACQVDAYYRWERAGRPDGRSQEFWAEAERAALRNRQWYASLAFDATPAAPLMRRYQPRTTVLPRPRPVMFQFFDLEAEYAGRFFAKPFVLSPHDDDPRCYSQGL